MKVAAVLTTRIATEAGGPEAPLGFLARWLLASSWTLTSTRAPRIPQNRASGTLKPQVPRSQNDW